MDPKTTNVQEIEKMISRIDQRKATGFENISINIEKEVKSEIVPLSKFEFFIWCHSRKIQNC